MPYLSSSSGGAASPPSGTTSITVGSGGSSTLTANTQTGACSIVLVDQSQTPITSTNYLNVNNIQIEIWTSGTSSQSATVGTLTYSGGSSGSAISYAMTLDRSGSMSYDSNASLEAAAIAFISGSGASDQGAVINFDDAVKVDQGLTTDKNLLISAVSNESTTSGLTALYDSMGTAVATAAAGSNSRKAVIAMTDGLENSSVNYTTTTAVINYANANSVPIYCVGLGSSVSASGLQAIASGTGGLYYYAPTAADIADLYNKISSALNSAWTINFTSPVTFTTGTTYYVKVTVTYSGGITASTIFTVTI
ncbi:MAG: VWA domain-containing protein [Candidatus Saganbacteria bacterium]|nr:VWA domain-containing protein [Candidatus Saganbacteria bacterium]